MVLDLVSSQFDIFELAVLRKRNFRTIYATYDMIFNNAMFLSGFSPDLLQQSNLTGSQNLKVVLSIIICFYHCR